MRKEYGKALRDMFTARMQADLPEWDPVTVPKTHYWGGERAFALDRSPVAWLVVILEPSLKDRDTFDVELGWSVHKRVPELAMRPCVEDPESSEAVARDEYLCRLSGLHGDEKYQDGWVVDKRTLSTNPDEILAALKERDKKITPAKARDTISPLLDDLMYVLIDLGIPYLRGRLPLLGGHNSQTSPDRATPEGEGSTT